LRGHFLLGDLTAAEHHAHAAREIYESFRDPHGWTEYAILAEIATARGDATGAAEWAGKRDELRAELKRRAGDGGSIPSQMLRALQQLANACARAGFGDEPLDPGAEEALATLDGYRAPFPAFATTLRELAEGNLPAVPPSWPKELQEILEGIVQAIRDSPSR
jgi:hypothetical protein